MNLTYLREDLGFKVTFDIDDVVYYEKTLSGTLMMCKCYWIHFFSYLVKNPPPLCFGVPYLENGAKLCLKFYSLDWTTSTFSGCVDLLGYLLDVKVGTVKIGCFHLGNHLKIFERKFEYYNEMESNEVIRIRNSSDVFNFAQDLVKLENKVPTSNSILESALLRLIQGFFERKK